MAQIVKCLPGMRETRVQPLGWEDPLEKEMATHSCTPGKFHGLRSMVGYSPWVHKESDTVEQLLYLVTGRGHNRMDYWDAGNMLFLHLCIG